MSDRNQLCPACAEKEVSAGHDKALEAPPPPDRPWHWFLVIFAPRFWLAIGELLISPKAIAMYRSWKERSLPTDERLLELTEFFQQSSVECRRETQRLREETNVLESMSERFALLMEQAVGTLTCQNETIAALRREVEALRVDISSPNN